MELGNLIEKYNNLLIAEVIDHDRFKLIAIDHHSTRIEGSMTIVVNIDDAVTKLTGMSPVINNLLIGSHGFGEDNQGGYFKIGGTKIQSASEVNNRFSKDFNAIANKLSKDAEVVLLACRAGARHNEGVSIMTALSKKLNATVFGNQVGRCHLMNFSIHDGIISDITRKLTEFHLITLMMRDDSKMQSKMQVSGRKSHLMEHHRQSTMFTLIQKQEFNMTQLSKVTQLFSLIVCMFLSLNLCDAHDNGREQPHYSEIDPFSLKGTGVLMDGQTYPYVTIENVNANQKRIMYWFTKAKHNAEEYLFEKQDKSWVTSKTFSSDTGKVLIIKKVFENKVVFLEYENRNTPSKPLSAIRIFEGNTLTSYYLSKSINAKVGLFDPLYLKKPMNGIVKDIAKLENESVEITVSSILNKKIQTFNYHVGKHSLNWWYTFENYLISKQNI